MKADIRMIAMDMDGTMLDGDGQASPRTRRALIACEAKGIKIILASGRSFFNIREYYKEMGLMSPMLSVNGVRADASPMGPMLFDSFLPEATAREIVRILRAERSHFDLFTRWDVYDEFPDSNYPWHDKTVEYVSDGIRQRIVVDCPRLTDEEGVPNAYKFITMTRDRARLERIRAALLPLDVDLAASGSDNIEIIQRGVNKGTGLAKLAAHFGIDRSQVMAFGDFSNDIEMLAWAGESFAMGNAIDSVKRIARHAAPANYEDGVARMIEEWAL